MTTTRMIGLPEVDMVPNIRVAHPRGAGQRAALNTGPLQLHHALAQVEELQRALGSSQQASIAAQHQVEILTDANERLKVLAGQPEYAGTKSASQHSTLNLGDFCSSTELDPRATPEIKRILTQPTRIRKDDVLHRVGDRFNALYAIRIGSCKTVLLANDGQDQVAGFHMAGETIGVDEIATDIHECEAIALKEMEVCRLPFDQIERLAQLSDELSQTLHTLLSASGRPLPTVVALNWRCGERLASGSAMGRWRRVRLPRC